MTTKENVLLVLDLQKSNVRESFPSIFSREDVLNLLDGIEDQVKSIEDEGVSVNFDIKKVLNDLMDKIQDDVENTIDNYDYDSDINVEMNYDRRIEFEFRPSDGLLNEVKTTIRDTTEEFLEELEEVEEVTEEVEENS
jgi:hypothetical protein